MSLLTLVVSVLVRHVISNQDGKTIVVTNACAWNAEDNETSSITVVNLQSVKATYGRFLPQ